MGQCWNNFSRGVDAIRESRRGRLASSHWLTCLAWLRFGLPIAQTIAATAQLQRRKWKILMSRFQYRICRCGWEEGYLGGIWPGEPLQD